MPTATLYEQLTAAGLSDADARAALAKHPDPAAAGVPPEQRPANRFDEILGQADKWTGIILFIAHLLRQYSEQGNLTPGQHPATQQALAALEDAAAPKEASSGKAASYG